MKRMVLALGVTVGIVGFCIASARGAVPNPPGLRAQVLFWKKIFSVYSTDQVVVHDSWNLDRIYTVVDFHDAADGVDPGRMQRYQEERVDAEKRRIQAVLSRLAQMPDGASLSAEERRIRAMFPARATADDFTTAAADEHIRAQRGLRERFGSGLAMSRRYLPDMERIFRHYGLPVELTRLPFVESCFNVHAYSKAGAAGIWQFMPSTGRLYLTINAHVDERRDPIASSHAAAQLLLRNYEVLGTWPLAVTAYNHGRAGIARAVDSVGTRDIETIIERYHGPLFKFASRNFYAEFLAAIEVENEYEVNFGDVVLAQPIATEVVTLPQPASLPVLAQAARSNVDELVDLNPALTPDVVHGRLAVPSGYDLRVPFGHAQHFDRSYVAAAPQPARKAPAKSKTGKARKEYVKHVVKPGQTLASIAKQYRVSVSSIQRHNKLGRGHSIRAGQSLLIPEG